jgi:hypothetical protein
MKVTIVKEDGLVIVNGIAQLGLDLSALDSSFRALQWGGESGDLEEVFSGLPVNTEVTSLTPYQWCIDLWQVATDAANSAE